MSDGNIQQPACDFNSIDDPVTVGIMPLQQGMKGTYDLIKLIYFI